MALNTYKVGLLVGQLMKELLTEEEFHKGYQAGINPDPDSLTILKKAYQSGGLTEMTNSKIPAIRKYREETGDGLKEAKDKIEEWMERICRGAI